MNSLPANIAANVADKVSEGLTGDEGDPFCNRSGTKFEEARGEALTRLEWFFKFSPAPSCFVGEIFGKLYDICTGNTEQEILLPY